MLLNEDNRSEFIGQIIDIFEDYLAEREFKIPNQVKDGDVSSAERLPKEKASLAAIARSEEDATTAVYP